MRAIGSDTRPVQTVHLFAGGSSQALRYFNVHTDAEGGVALTTNEFTPGRPFRVVAFRARAQLDPGSETIKLSRVTAGSTVEVATYTEDPGGADLWIHSGEIAVDFTADQGMTFSHQCAAYPADVMAAFDLIWLDE